MGKWPKYLHALKRPSLSTWNDRRGGTTVFSVLQTFLARENSTRDRKAGVKSVPGLTGKQTTRMVDGATLVWDKEMIHLNTSVVERVFSGTNVPYLYSCFWLKRAWRKYCT